MAIAQELHQRVNRTNLQGYGQGQKRRPRITMPVNPPWRLPRQQERAPPGIDQQQPLSFSVRPSACLAKSSLVLN